MIPAEAVNLKNKNGICKTLTVVKKKKRPEVNFCTVDRPQQSIKIFVKANLRPIFYMDLVSFTNTPSLCCVENLEWCPRF